MWVADPLSQAPDRSRVKGVWLKLHAMPHPGLEDFTSSLYSLRFSLRYLSLYAAQPGSGIPCGPRLTPRRLTFVLFGPQRRNFVSSIDLNNVTRLRRGCDELLALCGAFSRLRHWHRQSSRNILAQRHFWRHSLPVEAVNSFYQDLNAAPEWVQVWVNFMGAVFALGIVFAFRRIEARLALLVMAVTIPAMIGLHSAIGYSRLLGIVHVVLWTPLAVWLWRRRGAWRAKETLSGKWIALLFATIIVSLAFDYADVVRWLMGERG